MHFLLTNDDGIEAPGLFALAEAIASLPGATSSIVAPDSERSQCGHRVTTHETLVVTQLDEHRHSVSGTPADCVRVALFALGLKPDFVVSGINAGGNMGQDVYISGTVAGVREAAYHGLPGAAFSHYLVSGLAVDWKRTARWAAETLQKLLTSPLKDGEFWNVNFPHLPADQQELPDCLETQLCRSPMKVSYLSTAAADHVSHLQYNARYADRPQDSGSDVATCFSGKVSLTKLSL
jgi:5'-nucleotidase